jgi:mono/diheme cytochrome c family protein
MSIRFGVLAAFATATLLVGAAKADDQIARGKYLATIMDCAGCHTPMTPEGMPDFAKALQGANYGFEIPGLGTFVPPNLTSDETGLGGWSDEQVIAAITRGERPDGRILAPIMPYHSYGALTPNDAKALVAYLRSVPHADYKAPGPWGPGEKPTLPYLGLKMPG